MTTEENLALDAMRGDNIIDLETRQQYEALMEAAMGDYQGKEAAKCYACEGDGCTQCKTYERIDTYTDSVGVRYQSVTDVRTGVKTEVIRDYKRVVPTPTSGRQQAIAEAEAPNRGERMKQIAYEITGIANRLRPGPEANRLYDLAYEIDQLFLNQK